MSFVTRARDAVVEAVLAAAVVGIYEGVSLGAIHHGLAVTPVAAAVATLAAILAALALRVGLSVVLRIGSVRTLIADLAGGGTPRVVAVWRVLLVLTSAILFGLVTFHGFAWAHETFRFNHPGVIGLAFTFASLSVLAILFLAARSLDARVAHRLPASLVTRRRGIALCTLGALLVLAGPPLIVRSAAPELKLEQIITASLLLSAVLVATFSHAGRHRLAQIVAGVLVVAALVGTWALSKAPRARVAIVERGVTSYALASALLSVADGDGDGFAPVSSGGADCDDSNPRRGPRSRDIPGNGVDENCSGADAVATSFGLRTQTRPVPPVAKQPNIVLISIDTLRADHVGSYGYKRKTSPALDALAAGGVRFARAFTSCPSTRCSVPALHTGRYESTFGEGAARDAIPNIAGVLRHAGWTTAAITCCDRFAIPRGELAQFATINAAADTIRMSRAGQSNADVVVDYALTWLQTIDRSKPYFVWMHLYEPHFPYEAPSGPSFGSDEVARYDREIAFADAQLARFLAALDPSTIVVVTSDHGEEFGEHGVRFHARSLYNQVVRVPLIMRVPGVAPRVVETPVSIIDIMPTLLELAGVEGPAGMNGRSLVPALRGGQAPARPILIELERDHQIKRDMAAVVRPPWKVIWDREANAWSVYHVDDIADANERSDDAPLAELQRLLLETLDRETGVLP